MAGKDLGYAGPAPASPPARARRVPLWRELAVLLLLAAGLTVIVKTFAVEAFRIPSGSMEDTLIPPIPATTVTIPGTGRSRRTP